MAAIHTTSTLFQAATKVVKKTFVKTMAKVPKLYDLVLNNYPNDPKRPFFSVLPIVGLTTYGLKPEGAGPLFDQAFEGTASTFNFLTYALAYKITEEAELEDAQSLLKRLPAMLAYSGQITKELLFWQIYNLAFTSGVNGIDGLSLCNAAHTLQGSGATYSNTLGGVALTPESLQSAFVTLETSVDDKNLPIYRTPKTLICPPQIHKVAEEVLGSPYYPYSNENKTNVVQGKVDLVVSRYITLTSPAAWFVQAAKGDLEGDTHSLGYSFKWENRQRTWIDDPTGNFNQRASFRATWGFVDYRGIVGSSGA